MIYKFIEFFIVIYAFFEDGLHVRLKEIGNLFYERDDYFENLYKNSLFKGFVHRFCE